MKKVLALAVCAISVCFSSVAQERGMNISPDEIIGTYYVSHGGENSKVRVFKDKDGTFSAQVFWVEHSTDEIPCKMFTGEDLQGIYWGCELFITNSLLKSIYGVTNLETGHMIKGNIFNVSTVTNHITIREGKQNFSPLDGVGILILPFGRINSALLSKHC